jgi:diguanylate cyclase (GGDEF)-like protein/putative nucleotidyltransferase with HDIG domain
MHAQAKLFIAAVCLIGFTSAGAGLWKWHSDDPVRFISYLILATLSARFSIALPSIPGTLSAAFVFQFLSIIELSMSEALAISWVAALAQNLKIAHRPTVAKIAFNVATLSLSVESASFVYHIMWHALGDWGLLVGLMSAALVAYGVNTFAVTIVISLINRLDPFRTWIENYLWSFPYYLAGAALAGLMGVASATLGWQTSLMILPVVYLFYRSYSTYVGRLEDSKNHAEEVSALHLRTIESLALAIEAKDDTTHAHLRRVQTYALALGRDLNLNAMQLEALRAAAILHDIGKLAVPEHIICKPGKLTPDEFEKMKIHPVVGAEILEHVKFPYPVAPIVRSHHEKWNGAGYPDGLKGEEIPIGARILAAVDCLDALASDRQYRKALPVEEAMRVVVAESGKSFDPQIVDLLQRRFIALEQEAVAACSDVVKLSTNIKVERGEAPAAGFEASAPTRKPSTSRMEAEEQSFLAAIASARCEVQTLFDLANELGDSLSLPETLALVTSRLKPVVPHESAVLWVRNGQELEAYYVEGANRALFESLRIPLGEGLAGWVAQNNKPILNGNPAVEPGYLNDPSKFTTLRSALAVPLSGVGDFTGVLAFYRADRDAFSKDHQRILLGVAAKLATSIENALNHQALAEAQTHDLLTGLPNLGHLLERFDAELERSRRSGAALAVVICDVNGLKAINSRYGYESGDQLLKELADGLRGMFREYDLVARIGGDEFAIVIPQIEPDTAAARIKEVHNAAEIAARVLGGQAAGMLSLSTGEAFYPKDGDSVEDLLSTADRRMSLAKKERAAQPFRVANLPPSSPPRRPAGSVGRPVYQQPEGQPVPVAG